MYRRCWVYLAPLLILRAVWQQLGIPSFLWKLLTVRKANFLLVFKPMASWHNHTTSFSSSVQNWVFYKRGVNYSELGPSSIPPSFSPYINLINCERDRSFNMAGFSGASSCFSSFNLDTAFSTERVGEKCCDYSFLFTVVMFFCSLHSAWSARVFPSPVLPVIKLASWPYFLPEFVSESPTPQYSTF